MQIVSFLGNFVNAIETSFASGIGWLITFCAERGGRCMKYFSNKANKKSPFADSGIIPFVSNKKL